MMPGAHRKTWTREDPPRDRRPWPPYEGRHQEPPESADCTPTVTAVNPLASYWWGERDEAGDMYTFMEGRGRESADHVTLVLRVSRAAVSERLDPTWTPQKAEALAEIEAALQLACRQALGLGGNGGDVLC